MNIQLIVETEQDQSEINPGISLIVWLRKTLFIKLTLARNKHLNNANEKENIQFPMDQIAVETLNLLKNTIKCIVLATEQDGQDLIASIGKQ